MRGPIIALMLISSIVTAATVSFAQDAAKAEAELKQLQAEIDRIRNQVARDAAERDRLARSLRTAERLRLGRVPSSSVCVPSGSIGKGDANSWPTSVVNASPTWPASDGSWPRRCAPPISLVARSR